MTENTGKFEACVEESNAKFSYSKVCEKQHSAFRLEEPGLLLRTEYSWLGARLDGIRKCSCCNPSVVEFKCPFNGPQKGFSVT